jgi:general secretion pathway protein G
VVVILGILAAIVIPQFTDASTEAKTSSLCSDLQTVRSQIELYKIQHNDALPDMTLDSNEDNDLTIETDIAGAAYTSTSTSGPFGPYLQKMPTNPFNDSKVVTAGTSPAVTSGSGWYFDTGSGDFMACDSTDHLKL